VTSPRGPVVVGVDGSPDAERALEWAAELAADLGVEVVAVHVIGLLSHLQGHEEPAQAHRGELYQRLAGEWTVALRRRHVPHRVEVVDGNPVTGLLATASVHGASMVVVGSRGSGGFPGLQLGSTGHQLAQHATLPVTIVPGPRPAVAASGDAAPGRPPDDPGS
jgi:nucleotide-binding universal stress UspA family protein